MDFIPWNKFNIPKAIIIVSIISTTKLIQQTFTRKTLQKQSHLTYFLTLYAHFLLQNVLCLYNRCSHTGYPIAAVSSIQNHNLNSSLIATTRRFQLYIISKHISIHKIHTVSTVQIHSQPYGTNSITKASFENRRLYTCIWYAMLPCMLIQKS